MVALAADKAAMKRDGKRRNDPVAANVQIYAGALVCLNATGYATPGAVATTLTTRGVAQENVNNVGGADGALTVETESGVFHFANDGTIARADIGNTAYVVDDQTVADNDGTGTRSIAGEIIDVDADGVWVDVG